MFSKITVICEKFLRLLIFSILPSISLAQTAIHGHVVDAETNTGLPGANVYIANTTKGSVTDVTGAFRIEGLQPGHYKIIVSFVGYGTQVIDVQTTITVGYKILLRPSPQQLKELVIHSKKRSRGEWVANFNMFKEHFIGLSDNYRFCTFQNPRVLDFERTESMLEAKSDSIIVIENRGLGYRIKVFLELYQYNIMLVRTHYVGQIVFEQLEAKDENEEMEWARARLKAYYGSEMHFLRALYKHRLNKEGYFFNVIKDVNLGQKGGIKHIGYADSVKSPRAAIYNYRRIKMHTLTNYNRILDSVRSTKDQPILKFKGELDVQYIHEPESFNYQVARGRSRGKNPQVSQMKMLADSAIIQPNGQLYPPDAVETRGYWSWELMAEALPLNYDPEEDQDLTGFRLLLEDER